MNIRSPYRTGQLIALYQEGLSLGQISQRMLDETGETITRQAIHHRLKGAGVTMRDRLTPSPVSIRERQQHKVDTMGEYVALYNDGWSASELAALAGLKGRWKASRMARKLSEAGATMRGRGARRGKLYQMEYEARTRQAVQLYRAGLTLEEVGEVMGLSAAALVARFNRVNEPRRHSSHKVPTPLRDVLVGNPS